MIAVAVICGLGLMNGIGVAIAKGHDFPVLSVLGRLYMYLFFLSPILELFIR